MNGNRKNRSVDRMDGMRGWVEGGGLGWVVVYGVLGGFSVLCSAELTSLFGNPHSGHAAVSGLPRKSYPHSKQICFLRASAIIRGLNFGPMKAGGKQLNTASKVNKITSNTAGNKRIAGIANDAHLCRFNVALGVHMNTASSSFVAR